MINAGYLVFGRTWLIFKLGLVGVRVEWTLSNQKMGEVGKLTTVVGQHIFHGVLFVLYSYFTLVFCAPMRMLQ